MVRFTKSIGGYPPSLPKKELRLQPCSFMERSVPGAMDRVSGKIFHHYKELKLPQPDYSPVISDLEEEYKHYAPRSRQLQERACRVMVDGGSHGRRLNRPFPPRITRASGAWLIDQDGHRILDFWQGHFANLLGHNAPFLTETLAEGFQNGFGLQTGFTDELQIEVAEILCKQTGAEKVRFTTSGTLGTMYATLLGRAYTGRDLVMKIGGGFHGAQPWGLKRHPLQNPKIRIQPS